MNFVQDVVDNNREWQQKIDALTKEKEQLEAKMTRALKRLAASYEDLPCSSCPAQYTCDLADSTCPEEAMRYALEGE